MLDNFPLRIIIFFAGKVPTSDSQKLSLYCVKSLPLTHTSLVKEQRAWITNTFLRLADFLSDGICIPKYFFLPIIPNFFAGDK